MMKYKLSIVFLLVAMLYSCTAIYEDGKELAGVIKKDICQISKDSLQKHIDDGEEFLLIDVRQSNEYESGNIIGSFSIPRGELEFLIEDEAFWEEQFMYVPLKTDKIIVYCKHGDRGILAAQALEKLGFTNVSNLDGGYAAFAGDEKPDVKKVDAGGCGG